MAASTTTAGVLAGSSILVAYLPAWNLSYVAAISEFSSSSSSSCNSDNSPSVNLLSGRYYY
jgi:hypothetical protein